MTRPRVSSSREIVGILGTHPDRKRLMTEWNAFFAREGIDAAMDHYPCTEKIIPERLSEMFHFDRRFYIVGKSLQLAIKSYLDRLDATVEAEEGSVTVVRNDGGVLTGYDTRGYENPREFWDNLKKYN